MTYAELVEITKDNEEISELLEMLEDFMVERLKL